MDKAKPGRGGSRPGAGRKSKYIGQSYPITFRLPGRLVVALDAAVDDVGGSRSDYLIAKLSDILDVEVLNQAEN